MNNSVCFILGFPWKWWPSWILKIFGNILFTWTAYNIQFQIQHHMNNFVVRYVQISSCLDALYALLSMYSKFHEKA